MQIVICESCGKNSLDTEAHIEVLSIRARVNGNEETGFDGKIEAWARAKKKRTVDYVVVGHGVAEKGTPNLDLGLYKKKKLVKVLTCVLPPAWRVADPVSLVGRVVEAAGWEIWPSGALRHAQLGGRPGPRTDKRPEDCTYESAMRA